MEQDHDHEHTTPSPVSPSPSHAIYQPTPIAVAGPSRQPTTTQPPLARVRSRTSQPSERPISVVIAPPVQVEDETLSARVPSDRESQMPPWQGIALNQPLPPVPRSNNTPPPFVGDANGTGNGNGSGIRRARTIDNNASRHTGIDYIVPVANDDRPPRAKTVGERLDPTLATAISERNKYAFKAKMTGYALNLAIGLQVLLGALTTGLSVVTTGKQTSIMTTILGGLATLVASYLARARGSNEPELSIARVKDLEQFIRESQAFMMDYGHITGNVEDERLDGFRRRFEELLGNANGERKLSPPV